MAFGGKENIQIVATARDQASPTLKRLQKNVTALGSKGRGPLGGLLSGMGGISPVAMGAALGVGVLAGALADGVAGALAEEKQLARLDQALKANVTNTAGAREAVDQFTTAAMDLSFADDEARESMIKLVTATGNVEEAMRDSRLAMDIARGRNIDLAAATDIVIKANMGNVGALRRLGIELDKGADKTEILATLQERYSGQAEAYADTTAGKFESAQKKVDDALENVGHTLVDVTAKGLDLLDVLHQLGAETRGGLDDFLNPPAPPDNRPFLGPFVVPPDFEGPLLANVHRLEAPMAEAGGHIADIFIDRFGVGLAQAKTNAAAVFADRFTDDLAGTLRSNKDVVTTAMDDLMWAMNHPNKLAKEGARIEGALTSAALAEGLASNNPMIRAVAEQQKAALEAQWFLLTGSAYQEGVSAANALERGLRTFHTPNFSLGKLGLLERDARQGRAAGGPVNAGETYLVGERGPELLHMGKPGQVQSNASAFGGREPIRVVSVAELRRLLDEDNGRLLALAPSSNYSR